MDDAAKARAVELLGRFNDDLTRVIDSVFGTRWAEIEEIIALIVIVTDGVTTTRRLSEVSGLTRRTVSRLIVRLGDEGMVRTRQSEWDGRVTEVTLTDIGEDRAAALRTRTSDFLDGAAVIARDISDGLRLAPHPRVPENRSDPLPLLLRVTQAGASLVRYMPSAATRGRMAARQRAALVRIATHGTVRPGELAAPLELSPAGVAYVVDQLCKKGFVRRLPARKNEDGRAVILVASSSGMEAVAAVAAGIEKQRQLLSELFAEVAAWRPMGGPLSSGTPGQDADRSVVS